MLKNLNYNFQNRHLVIATKHKKELVIAPLLIKHLKVKPFVPTNFDTDKFGTFTGERERTKSAYETAKEKCFAAMELTGADAAIASEGSFGMHPDVGFIPLNEEIILFIDQKFGLEISVIERSTKTNFKSKEVVSLKELIEFAHQCKFPSHAMILRQKTNKKDIILKGLTEPKELKEKFILLQKNGFSITAETDMRAMNNPTRMDVIKSATLKLVRKIKNKCPQCDAPGFGIEDIVRGLKCSVCSLPTKSIQKHLYRCAKCKFELQKKLPNHKTTEDPMYCDFCNP